MRVQKSRQYEIGSIALNMVSVFEQQQQNVHLYFTVNED